jgi:hypothetical protein
MDEELYAELAGRGPNDAVLGHAFISLVEPHRGYESAYTRWYEDDHFQAGAMAFPWWFSGRRWIATADLRALRAGSDAATTLDQGWSLGTYWITARRLTEQVRWLEATIPRLTAAGRMFEHRTHVMTGFFDLKDEWQRADHQPRAVHALEYPYAGLVLEIIDQSAAEGVPLATWLRDTFVPQRLAAGEAAQCLHFAPLPWPGAGATSWFDYAEASAQRAVLVWFLEQDPRTTWPSFARHQAAIDDAGVGSLAFIGGFVPALPGTDRYLDQIR